ncbi:MAG: hypothetical protein ACLUKN_06830 [Bacilli bacterium]
MLLRCLCFLRPYEYKVGSFNILGGDVSQPDNAERAAVGSALVFTASI